MFDLLALLTMIVSLMAPALEAPDTGAAGPAEEGGLVTTMSDGTPQPPGRR
jgi:hypothetical protein